MVGENKTCEGREEVETGNESAIERRAVQSNDKGIGRTAKRRTESVSASLSGGGRRIEPVSVNLSIGGRRTEDLGHRLRYLLVLLLGSVGYPLAELCWRGRTHWSMALLGGLCLCGILYVSECTEGVLDLFSRALLCGIIISEAEFIFGVMFNLIAGLGIWDYTEKPLNLLGQVCAEYSLLWLSLSLPAISLFDACRAREEHRE